MSTDNEIGPSKKKCHQKMFKKISETRIDRID